MNSPLRYEILIIDLVKKIKRLNQQTVPPNLGPDSALYGDGADLDSKDMMELLIYLEDETELSILESAEYSPEALKTIGSLAAAFSRLDSLGT